MLALVRIGTLARRRCIPPCRLDAWTCGQRRQVRTQPQERYHLSAARRRPLPTSASISSRTLSTRRKDTTPTPDTIYALSTSAGRAAIAVVRISGPGCLDIYGALCPNRPFPNSRVASLRKLRDPQDSARIIDPAALVLYFPSPNTVTGEDVLELHCHGGPAIVRAVLESIPRCSDMGRLRRKPAEYSHTRPAEPGEFTRRAFWNGRVDLLEAEALGEALSAETEMQRKLAVESQSASGGLVERYEKWRGILLHARAEMEALIDFSEDQHFDESPRQLVESVATQVDDLKFLIDRHVHNARKGELLRGGISVALLGAPNAGKSSLLNLIVGREAAIVSAEAGTTRDIVDVSVDLDGWLVRLGDMAGLRGQAGVPQANNRSAEMNQALRRKERETLGLEDEDQKNFMQTIGAVEREGIRRARARALQSDVVIVLLPVHLSSDGSATIELDSELIDTIHQCKDGDKELLFVLNKTDLLSPDLSSQPIQALKNTIAHQFPAMASTTSIIPISCIHAASPTSSTDSDPGNIQALIRALTSRFTSMTSTSTSTTTDTEGQPITTATPGFPQHQQHDQYWHASLSISHRQSRYLIECLDHLSAFMAMTSSSSASAQGQEEVGEEKDDGDGDGDDLDIVLSAEHLRQAATCLAKITGRGEGGDVEDVLGVVFEKFCVGK